MTSEEKPCLSIDARTIWGFCFSGEKDIGKQNAHSSVGDSRMKPACPKAPKAEAPPAPKPGSRRVAEFHLDFGEVVTVAPPANVSEPPIDHRFEAMYAVWKAEQTISVALTAERDALKAENAELRAKVLRYEDLILQEEFCAKHLLNHGGEYCKCFLCWEARAIRAAREGAKK